MNPILFFDLETYSECNLFSAGSAKYARDPSTEILMITWSFDQGPVYYHDVANDGPIPFGLMQQLLSSDYVKCAANIPFDRAILKHVAGITIPWSQCVDSHVLAYSLGFSGGLGAIGEQVGLSEDQAKIKEGKKLIQRFCSPQPARNKVRRWTRDNSPVEWQRFADYAIRDTASMRELWMLTSAYNTMDDRQWDLFRLTQQMNDRGMPIDPMLVDQAIKMVALRKSELKTKMIELTGLDNPNSGTQLLPWLLEQGLELPNLQAETVDNALSNLPDGLIKMVLTMKRIVGQTAVTKWNSIKKMLCPDNTIKGMFVFKGASRTGRDASRGINLQNLRRPPKGQMDDLIKYVYYGDNNLINLIHGEPLEFLAKTVRGAITAPENNLLAVSDLSSIESRVVGWLTGCQRINNIFADGRDTYKDLATSLYNVSYDDVTKEQRTFAKPCALGAAYQLGGKGLQGYAGGMGVDMGIDEASQHIRTFRTVYHEIPSFWYWIQDAIAYTIATGETCNGFHLEVSIDRDFLFIRLPSGRKIAYHKPLWQQVTISSGDDEFDEFDVMALTYMGINRFKSSPTWERVNASGGGILENIVQGITADILMEWVWRCQDLHIVMRIHDEMVAVVADDIAEKTLEYMNNKISLPILWAPGLLLSAEGYISKHYQKD